MSNHLLSKIKTNLIKSHIITKNLKRLNNTTKQQLNKIKQAIRQNKTSEHIINKVNTLFGEN